MTKKQWHYTSATFTDFLYKNAETEALYVEGTRVDGVDVKKYLPHGIVREVIARNGKLYIWSDVYALAFAKADDILQKWTQLVPHAESRDVLLYLQAVKDKSVMDKIIDGELSFDDEVFPVWIRSLAGIAPVHNEFNYRNRESLLTTAKISNLLFNAPEIAEEMLSTHRVWCYLRADEKGIPRSAIVPTIREHLSVFPEQACDAYPKYMSSHKDCFRKQDLYDLTLSHAELLMMTFGDRDKSYKLIDEEQNNIHPNTTWDEWVSPARKFKVLFNEDASLYLPDKVRRYTYSCFKGVINRDPQSPYLEDYLHYAAVCKHLAGNVEKAREALEMAVNNKPSDHLEYFKLALAWKNIGDDEQRAASIIKEMEKAVPSFWNNVAFCALAAFEITGDMDKALYWAQKSEPRSLSIFFPPGIPFDPCIVRFFDWCRSNKIECNYGGNRGVLFARNPPGRYYIKKDFFDLFQK